ncbi:hypothetical protein [Thauera humireducens]|uniref:hypothetical protein n=1 Tax=Thauera humireducens TaxID=1134435 RepID=UPI00311F4011
MLLSISAMLQAQLRKLSKSVRCTRAQRSLLLCVGVSPTAPTGKLVKRVRMGV